MTNPLTAGREALITRLQTITKANGYQTDAGGNVKSGWFNDILQSGQQQFPLIVVQKAKGMEPEAGPGAIKAKPGYFVVGAVDAGLSDYEAALDALEVDILRRLMPMAGRVIDWAPRGITGVDIGPPEHFPPGNGEKAAVVMIPIHLHTIIRGA